MLRFVDGSMSTIRFGGWRLVYGQGQEGWRLVCMNHDQEYVHAMYNIYQLDS